MVRPEETSSKEIENNHHLVKDKASLEKLFHLIEKASKISFYTVFDNENNPQKKLLGAGIVSMVRSHFTVLWGVSLSSNNKNFLPSIWADKKKEVISDHLQEDMAWILAHDIDFLAKTFDVSQAFYNIGTSAENSLDTIALQLLDKQLPDWNREKELEKIHDDHFACNYCCQRAMVLYELAEILKDKLREESLEKIYHEIDDPLIPILASMENYGVAIDLPFFQTFEQELQKALSQRERDISLHNDGDPVNLNSPKQVAEFLYDRLKLPVIKKIKTGISTDFEVLVELASRNLSPVPELLLQHRELSKILSTYIKAIPLLVNPKTARVHTHFRQNTVATGRLSSIRPNLQNIFLSSQTWAAKSARDLSPVKGFVLLSADYSQVELRILAHLSGDKIMIDAFKEDRDIHSLTASEIFGIPLDAVTTNNRVQAKAVNFGLIYGQSSFGLAKILRIPVREAKDYITKYFERFSRVKSFLDELKEECEKTGYARTFHGRKRYLPDINSENRKIKSHADRMAINTPIQGTAADIIKAAMIRIAGRMAKDRLKSRMILQVHDELIFEVAESEENIMEKIVVEEMENVVQWEIPLKVTINFGKNWFDLK